MTKELIRTATAFTAAILCTSMLVQASAAQSPAHAPVAARAA